MENLETVLAESIIKFNGAVEKGVEFSIEQAPDLINQALTWNFITSALSMVGFFIAIYVIYALNRYQIKAYRGSESFRETFNGGACLVNFIQILWPFILFDLFSIEWLKIWIAPKLWLVEYAADLVK